MRIRTVFVCFVTMLAAGASVPVRSGPARITADELLAGRPLGLSEDRSARGDDQDVIALTAEMRTFVDERVAGGVDTLTRLRQLSAAINLSKSFRLAYDETTRTAAGTFEARRGNCMSFSNMFVAMARYAGLNAQFQEVDTPPDWSLRADTFVLNLHVNVLVDLGQGPRRVHRLGSLIDTHIEMGERIVDFNMDDFRTSYDRRPISDARALAHYHNNLAVEGMQAGNVAAALGRFRRAVTSDPSFSPTWTNLGILYKREGHAAHAEAAHLQALKADPSDLVAMSNLASLYERLGDHKRAAAYRKKVAEHRNKNPYYHFQLAREAFRAEDYDAAIGHLKNAIRRKKKEDQFYFLLGMCELKKNDPKEAREWLARAEAVAATGTLKRRYAAKMDLLLSSARDQ
jgi:Flp pilus assembly protein TadD